MQTYYFSHDTTAFSDPKIKLLVHDLGVWSYAAYWVIIEMLAQSRDARLMLHELDKVLFASIQGKTIPEADSGEYNGEYGRLFIPREVCASMLEMCYTLHLLSHDDKYVWSESYNSRMARRNEISATRSVAGKQGATKRWKTTMANAIWQNGKHSKGKERKVNRVKEIKESDIPPKVKHLEFVHLTDVQYNQLCDSIGKGNTDSYISRLNDYIGAKGTKYNSHYHVISGWWRKDHPETPSTGPAGRDL